MFLDIAPPAPSSQSSATGGPPGAGPPTPANAAPAFAAMLARQASTVAGHAPHASPNTADTARDDAPRDTHTDKHGGPDAPDDPANSGLALVSMQPLPPAAAVLAAALASSGPPVPLALPPITTTASLSNTSEAMDTSLASAPASTGGTALLSGGELLPQPIQTPDGAAEHASASFALPLAVPPLASALSAGAVSSASPSPASAVVAEAAGQAALTAAGGTALGQTQAPTSPGAPAAMSAAPTLPVASVSGPSLPLGMSASASAGALSASAPAPALQTPASVPDTSASASTKLAVQGYAQFGQTALQNAPRPANNTSKDASAPALQNAAAAGKSAGQASAAQTQAASPAPALPGERDLTDWAQAHVGHDEDAKDKQGTGGEDGAGTAPNPVAAQVEETKPAAAPAALSAPADRAALMQQAADSLQALHAQTLGHGRGQMTLQLHPQDWGKLQVSVTMTPSETAGGGTVVTAHVVADSAAVKQALETGGADLRRTLHEAGLHLERLTITVRPGEASSEARGMGGNGGGEGGRNPSQDAQDWPAPGSRGESTASAAAGNGQAAFGGGGADAGTQNRARTFATPALGSMTDEHEEPTAAAAPVSRTTGRLDTRA